MVERGPWQNADPLQAEYTVQAQKHKAPGRGDRGLQCVGEGSLTQLAGVAPRVHATSVRLPILLIALVDFVDSVECSASGPENAADRGALPGTLATVRDGAARGPDSRASHR